MATTALCQTAGFAAKVFAVRNASFVRVRTAPGKVCFALVPAVR
jgi:hypothetical protein